MTRVRACVYSLDTELRDALALLSSSQKFRYLRGEEVGTRALMETFCYYMYYAFALLWDATTTTLVKFETILGNLVQADRSAEIAKVIYIKF